MDAADRTQEKVFFPKIKELVQQKNKLKKGQWYKYQNKLVK